MQLHPRHILAVLLLLVGAAGCTPKGPGGGTGKDSGTSTDGGGTTSTDGGGTDGGGTVTDGGGTTIDIPYVAEEICVGSVMACARLNTGDVACWGDDSFLVDADAVRLRCGGSFCFEDPTGAITCVERGGVRSTDVTVPPDKYQPMTDWWLNEGNQGGCGVQADSTAVCWPEGEAYFSAVSGRPARHIDFTFSCVVLIDTDGQVHSLYYDERCDRHDSEYVLYGMDFPPLGNDWQTVTGGDHHACVLDSEGRMECWGLSDEDLTPDKDMRFIQMDSGEMANCGVTTEGTIDCRAPMWMFKPTPIPPGDNWVQVEVAGTNACALDTAGQVTCFGDWSSSSSDIQDALHSDPVVP